MQDVRPATAHLLRPVSDVTINVTDYGNGTTAPPEKPLGLYITYNVLVILIAIVVMFSMGTGVTIKHLKTILVRPVGPIIGFVCQVILMPAVCFGYALALSLPDNIAIGMVLTGSCPGGTISNVMTFWSKADVILSVCMTAISTTLAVGSLPLNMFIYSRYWVEDMSKMPYGNMAFTVVYLWIAVIIGYLVGRKWPKTIPYFTRIGSIVAFLLILSAGLVQAKLYPELFDLNWETYLAALTMPIIGYVMGVILARIFCLKHKQRMAIGFETGIQNTSLALTVIAITFPSSYESSYYSQFTILYATVQIALSVAVVIGLWIFRYIKHGERPCAKKDSFGVMEDDDDTPQIGQGERHGQVTFDDEGPAQLVSVGDGTQMQMNAAASASNSDDKADSASASSGDSVTLESAPSIKKLSSAGVVFQNGHV